MNIVSALTGRECSPGVVVWWEPKQGPCCGCGAVIIKAAANQKCAACKAATAARGNARKQRRKTPEVR